MYCTHIRIYELSTICAATTNLQLKKEQQNKNFWPANWIDNNCYAVLRRRNAIDAREEEFCDVNSNHKIESLPIRPRVFIMSPINVSNGHHISDRSVSRFPLPCVLLRSNGSSTLPSRNSPLDLGLILIMLLISIRRILLPIISAIFFRFLSHHPSPSLVSSRVVTAASPSDRTANIILRYCFGGWSVARRK